MRPARAIRTGRGEGSLPLHHQHRPQALGEEREGGRHVGQVAHHAGRRTGVGRGCALGRATDGKTFQCPLHGALDRPTQRAAPADASATARVMRDLTDVTATLTFLPEGLRAVLVIERK